MHITSRRRYTTCSACRHTRLGGGGRAAILGGRITHGQGVSRPWLLSDRPSSGAWMAVSLTSPWGRDLSKKQLSDALRRRRSHRDHEVYAGRGCDYHLSRTTSRSKSQFATCRAGQVTIIRATRWRAGETPPPLDTPDHNDPRPPPDRSGPMVCQDIGRAVGGIGEGSVVAPLRYLSTPAAALRPSAIAQTISD